MSHDEIRGNESYIWILGPIKKKQQQTLEWSLRLDHGKIHASRSNEGNHYKLG
jgi:hypothetical protein